MSTEPIIRSIGFVDTFLNGHFTGWTYSKQSVEQHINLKINGSFLRKVLSNRNRPDVKAAGIEESQCGFNFTLRLSDLPSDGCVISLHEPILDTVLGGGRFLYKDGEIAPYEGENFAPRPLPIKTYLSIYDSTSSTEDTGDLLDASMNALAKAPPATLVAMAYLLILGRNPDPDGFKGSRKFQLFSDLEKRAFLSSMINSAEFATKRTVVSAKADLAKFAL